MSTAASTSTQVPPPLPSPTILLFARGLIALLDLWPALTIAVAEQWGGSESAEKKTWMASVIVDEFESRAVFLPESKNVPNGDAAPPQVDPKTATDPPLDLDDLGDLIHQMMSDEFDANIEDNSIDAITADILRLWKDLLQPAEGSTAERVVEALEAKAGQVRKSGINASSGGGPEEMYRDGEGDEGDWTDSDSDEEAPQLVDSTMGRKEKGQERMEPVIDDDGFELVQKGRRR